MQQNCEKQSRVGGEGRNMGLAENKTAASDA